MISTRSRGVQIRLRFESTMSPSGISDHAERAVREGAEAGIARVRRSIAQVAGAAVRGKVSERSAQKFRASFSSSASSAGTGAALEVHVGADARRMDAGSPAWSVKEGLLQAAYARGKTYADVPIHGPDRSVVKWRRVSANSKARWLHRAVPALNVLGEVRRRIGECAEALFREEIGSRLQGGK